MSETKVKPRPRQLLQGQFGAAEYQRHDMIARPERGLTIGDLMDPPYWAQVARLLQAFDRIEVRPVDQAWWAELLVLAVEPFSVTVKVLRHISLGERDGEAIEAPEGYRYVQRGRHGWSVVRDLDEALLHENAVSKEMADVWLTTHLRKMAA